MPADIVEVSIKGLMPTANGCAVFLGNDDKTFVIYVDPSVGSAISMTINGVKKERPLTHDLIGHLLMGFEIGLERIIINDVNDGTYFARIILHMQNELGRKFLELDARPSDSIVLALQQKRPIFVARKVFELVEDMSEILERVLKQQKEEPKDEGISERAGSPPAGILPGQPLTALAPMQDVTDLPFMRVMAHYGAPDYFFTEFFRVHAQSRPEKHIVRSLVENQTGRPIFAQLIGEEIPHMVRTVKELHKYPIAGIDLNMGCPAPKIYKKNVGGGLLRDPAKIDELIGALRDAVPGLFTVKMRIGFDSTENYERVLQLINKHGVNLLSVHGRTVKEGYRSDVHYDFIGIAARTVRCPVLANGNVTSAERAAAVLAETGAAGVMIGRHAIRNPWIFRQCRERLSGGAVFAPTLADVREYVTRLYRETQTPDIPEAAHVAKLKKYLNFVGQGVDAEGKFLFDMRRAMTEADLFAVCDRHLLAEPAKPFASEPYAGVIARPNCETPIESCSLDTITA